MKIGIDISQIIYETGVSWYTKKLIENLLRIDSEGEYILFGGSLRRLADLRVKASSFSGNYSSKLYPIAPKLADLVWNRLHLIDVKVLTGPIDVFHSSDWSQPPSNAFKVTTIHDLWPVKFPNLTHPKIVSVHSARLYWVKKEADRIIVPSLATKKDLIEMEFDEKKIVVIPEAPHIERKASNEEIELVKKKYNLHGGYVLGVGVNERKNTKNIIKAFDLAKAGKDIDLVLVGRKQIKMETTRGVRVLGHVPDSHLDALYAGSQALVFPSINEGFGLPILDAFVSETPVVTSNTSSMPEVAGNAAVLVDPKNVESIAEGISYALTHRQTLIKKGLQQVKKYSWEKNAEETLKVYKESYA